MFLSLLLNLTNCRFLLGFIENGILPRKLSSEEEEHYISLLFDEKNHQEARNQLICHNLRLVAHIASKYESKDENLDDLISLGTLGLVKAIDTFSLDKHVKLATYAAKCIENEILMALRSNKKCAKNVSLYETLSYDKDGSSIMLEDVIPSLESSLEDRYEKKHNLHLLEQYLHVLDPRELEIITLRYGLNHQEEMTQIEIARKYHISRSYVSRIEKRALIKLLSEFKKIN